MQKFSYLQSSLGRNKQAAPSQLWNLVVLAADWANLAVRTCHRMHWEAEMGRDDLRSEAALVHLSQRK